MMHWKATLCVLAPFFAAMAMAGCSKPCCLQEFDEIQKRAGIPPDLAANPEVGNRPTNELPLRAPRTVNNPDAEPYYITLSECIALALEKGTTGVDTPLAQIFNFISILNTGTVFFGSNDQIPGYVNAQDLNQD